MKFLKYYHEHLNASHSSHKLELRNYVYNYNEMKFEIKDMQLPAITIEGNNTNQVRIPKFGDNEEVENGK